MLSQERLQELVEVVGAENRHVLREVVELFRRRTPDQLVDLQEAAVSRDGERLLRAAHAVKSSAGNLGVEKLRERAWELELRARRRELEGVEYLLEGLEQKYLEGCRALDRWLQQLEGEGT